MKDRTKEKDQDRLAVLRSYHILDTLPEKEFDEITKLAAFICDTPVSLISLSDKNKQFFKSRKGLDIAEIKRSDSFCSDAINHPNDITIIPDARLDKRYSLNLLVNEPYSFIFYAGMPLTTSKGVVLGTLCVLDKQPRNLSLQQLEALKTLAAQVVNLMELRRNNMDMELAEIRLKASEANYKSLFDFSPLPKILLDIETLEILEVNVAAEEKYAYSKSELKGRNMGILINEMDINHFHDSLYEIKDSKKKIVFKPVIHRKKNGELMQAEMITQIIQYENRPSILAIVNDLTDKLNIESDKSQLASILENSLNEVYIFEIENLKFLYANKGALKNIGYEWAELKMLTPFYIKPEFNEEQFRAFIAPLLHDHKEKLIFVTRHRRKDGSLYDVEVHLQKMKFEGQPAFVALIIDVTVSKSRETKLEQLNGLLEKSNQELSDFAYVTAHDLQEPLRMVSSFTTLLDRKYRDLLDEKGKAYIHHTVDGAKRMHQLIQDILEYSKPGGIVATNESIKLDAILELVLNDLQNRIISGSAKVKVPDKTITLRGNQNALYRLFLNLTSNALKFIPENRSPEVTINWEDQNSNWEFSVSDNGIGIEKDYLPTLFKPFNRLKTKQTEGTGLGLATCKKIVDQHGGKIWVESIPGEGSQFFFTLPKEPFYSPG
ncbi:MAG: PAS domain S-box protein [Cyclobacteriaceae bacterium]